MKYIEWQRVINVTGTKRRREGGLGEAVGCSCRRCGWGGLTRRWYLSQDLMEVFTCVTLGSHSDVGILGLLKRVFG